MFYLIAKIMLFFISETNSYPGIIIKIRTLKKWGGCFQTVIFNYWQV